MIEHDAADPRATVLRKIALAFRISAETFLGINQELAKGAPEA